MIDIIVVAWIIWGALLCYKTPVVKLVGDIIAILLVGIVYNLIGAIVVSKALITDYQAKVIQLYLWLEPLQTVQLHGGTFAKISTEILSYILLLLMLIAFIGISRNIVGAFSETSLNSRYVNSVVGGLRNALLVMVILLLLPSAIIDTYWFHEIFSDSLVNMLLIEMR
jgi:inner membrane protein involved in colicin E2 resistance